MGLFGSSSKKKEEELVNGLTKEERGSISASLAMGIGTNDLDAVLQTYAPNTTEQIELNMKLSMKVIDWINVVLEETKTIKAQNAELKAQNEEIMGRLNQLMGNERPLPQERKLHLVQR